MALNIALNPGDNLYLTSTFHPRIWSNDQADRVYRPKERWQVPMELTEGTEIYRVKVCFPDDFHQTPIPPDSTGDCACDFEDSASE